MQKRNKYILIALAVIVGVFLFKRAAATPVLNSRGVSIITGTAYRALAGYRVRETAAPYSEFATTGSSTYLLVHGIEVIAINGTLTQVARVTYVDRNGNPVNEWNWYIDINALTTHEI